jgi:hypothetical protein
MYGFWAVAGGAGVCFASGVGVGVGVAVGVGGAVGVVVGVGVEVGVGVDVGVGWVVGAAVVAKAGAATAVPSPSPNTAIAAMNALAARPALFGSIDSSFRARAASAQRAVPGPVFRRANGECGVHAVSQVPDVGIN